MPRSSGTMSLVSGNPVVSGTVISSAVQNATMSDIANEITNSIPRDGSAPPTGPTPWGNFKLTGLGAATLATDAPQYQQIQSGASLYLTAVAGTNTITGTLASPTLAAYAAGNTFRFTSAGTNTGATTVNINGLGAKTINKDGAALVAGDIVLGRTYEIIYDGTNFNLISGVGITSGSIQSQTYTAFTTGGTSSAFTLTPIPAITANTTNQRFNVVLNAAPTGSPTLAVSGQTAANFKYYDSTGAKQFITSTVAPNGWRSDVIYDGTDWVMQNVLLRDLTVNSLSINGSGGLGFVAGSGGAVTQTTSKSTAVTLNKYTGRITMDPSALAANTTVSFNFNNSLIAAGDVVVINHVGGGSVANYNVWIQTNAATSIINVRNITAGSLSDALVLLYVVIKGTVI